MKKVLQLILLFHLYFGFSQQIEFVAETEKSTYGLDERIQLTYTINNEGDNFEPPSFAGFQVMGPSIYKGKSNQVINGRVIKREVYTQLKYFLIPQKKGKFVIKPASIEYKGKEYVSNKVEIEIIDGISTINNDSTNPNSPAYSLGEGLFIVAEVNTTTPYLNQPVELIYKVYFDPKVIITEIDEKQKPKYNGFWNQEIKFRPEKPVAAQFNGKNYGSFIAKKMLLYPLETGVQNLEPVSIDFGIEIQRKRQIGFMESIFLENIYKKVVSNPISITVKPLPEANKPDDFNGAVGDFKISLQPSKTQLKAGEALQLKVTIAGNGNMQLFSIPKPILPQQFELFEPEYKENIVTTANGISGSVMDTYTVVPQLKGEYTIAPVSFSYFDVGTNSYKTIQSEPYTISVLDNPDFVPSNSVANLDNKTSSKKVFQSIALKTKLLPITKKDFLGSILFYSLLLLAFIAIPVVIFVRKKKAAMDADVVGNKVKRNNKLARKYLGEAKKQLGNKVLFYLAIEKALHTFLKAKLQIETSEMSKENIEKLLLDKKVDAQKIEGFIELMNSCEFARYTPVSSLSMQNDYENALNRISELEKDLS